ncbi:BppU family phage baseplate upper protein [Enterococcus faecium]|uniref:BppU family phage baseplate upper protein n=1 Tax=Enterococcus faecium TaxID=1352 RepID=UPI00280E365D|nr:BppU family phage baseplate upper protein [Enterococcus faecium]MDQ8464184.1 BppU family phage baseplate upper protein [Enterococcus faecium]MDQ8464240.1 BppU family phage baseplate upper protein [Enterococcus faecium]
MFKINESIIVIQAEAIRPNKTDVVFWSHDRGTAKLRMKLVRKNDIPQSLPEGTTVPIRLIFKSATAENGYGKHDYLATIEDRVNGIVSIVLEDNILGYVGKVEGSVYIDFPNDRSLDTAGRFTFDIKRSPIDDSTPELEDYYFNGFSQTIDKVEKILADGKQEIDQKITESETQIDAKLKDTNDKITKANQDVATLNTNIDKANDRIDQTNQEISDLGKLKRMYSNSIDFGDYDYSGNPNLFLNPTFSDLSSDAKINTPVQSFVTDNGESFTVDLTAVTGERIFYINNLPTLLKSTSYTYSIEAKADIDLPNGIRVRPVYIDENSKTQYVFPTIIPNMTTSYKRYSYTHANLPLGYLNSNFHSLQFYFPADVPRTKITIKYNIKTEKGTEATSYQPNLLDDPYWIGKTPLGENIKDKGTVFPIKTSAYAVYSGANTEPYIAGQKYTLTMKATKPATQTFNVFLNSGTIGVGSMTPVEGLTDVWQKTFTVSQANIDADVTNRLAIYQVPNSSVGAVQIDWLKIEKGDTRTPNISEYKYFGEGLKDSNNPNNYSWDVTPEYAEKALTNTLNLTDPQTALGLKNFKDGAQIDGVDVATVKNLGSVLQSGSGLTTIQSDKQSAFDEFSYEFERIGDRVFFHARVKTNSTTAVASHVNLLEIPLGFQFPIGWTIVGVPLSVVQWTTPQGEISALVITDSTGKQVVKFATNRVGNHYISGEWRTADSYPETK